MDSNANEAAHVHWLRSGLLSLSFLLLGFCSLCYWTRMDGVAAVTVFPAWFWLIPGLLFAVIACRQRRRRAGAVAFTLWLAFLLVFSDAPMSLARLPLRPSLVEIRNRLSSEGRALRIITLNCNSSADSLTEVKELKPDIVLLQESPGRKEIEKLATDLFGADGGAVCGVDASIIARGRVVPGTLAGDCVTASVSLSQGSELDVVSLRLMPATFRFDHWNPDCWASFAENRRRRRDQLKRIARLVDKSSRGVPLILGGDFNAPPGDAVFEQIPENLKDAFHAAGVGWGNTIVNDWPFLRIDRIWVSKQFRPLVVEARRTRFSDHRMVICDVEVLEW